MTSVAKRDLALWLPLTACPVIWFASVEAKFALSPWICVFGWRPAVILVSLLALAITAGLGLLAWSQWRVLAHEQAPFRARAMALGGMALSIGFLIVLIAQSIPEWMLAGCE